MQSELLDGLGVAHHRGYGFTSESGFHFGKHRLVGEARNHAVTILSRNIFRSQNAVDSRMRGHERVEIAKTEACPLVGTADGADGQGAGGNFVSSENLRAIHLTLAVETDQPRPHRITGQGRRIGELAGAGILDGGNDLAIASAAAEHATDRVHDSAFRGRGVTLQKSGGRYQHARRAGPALRGAVAEERFLQLVIDRRAGGESFHRRDFMPLDLTGCDQAGTDRLAIQQDGAGATVPGVTADFGSHQPQMFTQHFGKPFQR